MSKTLTNIVVLFGLAVGLGIAGYWLQFTTFMIYDDEGYVLLSLKHFSEHGGLYDRVYSQYGPFVYLVYDGLHRLLGLEFDNVTARWLSLGQWLGIAVVCGSLVARTTQSALWASYTTAGTFVYLWVMINEPAHPGGLLAFFIATGALLGAELWNRNHPHGFAAVTAVIGAALLLTKINVGIFFLGSAFIWLALHTTPSRAANILTWLIAIGCAALPFVLMRALFDEPWVRLFALVFTGASLGLLMIAKGQHDLKARFSVWLVFVLIIVTTGAVVIALTLTRGTTFANLLDGVLLGPLKHPGVYFFAMNWRAGTGILALVSLGLVAWAVRTQSITDSRFQLFVAGARSLAALVFFCTTLKIIPTSQAAWGMCYGVSLAWLFVIPLRPDAKGAATRGWVALLLVFQFLHAYPVAGSQLNWGTFLWVTLLSLGMHDAAPLLRARMTHFAPWPSQAGMALVVAVTLFSSGQFLSIGWDRYSTSQPLGLSGAETIRLPNDITYALRITDENLKKHADMLFSLPGQFSANLRTGLPTPTLRNVTHWFSLLSEDEQEAIQHRLATSPRAMLLVQRESLNYLDRYQFQVGGPLHRWLLHNFALAIEVDGYELWTHRGRAIAPLSTARVNRQLNSTDPVTLALCLDGIRRPVTRIELCDVHRPDVALAVLDAGATRVTLRPLNPDGTSNGASTAASWPIAFDGITSVELTFPGLSVHGSWQSILVVLRDATGDIVAEARVRE